MEGTKLLFARGLAIYFHLVTSDWCVIEAESLPGEQLDFLKHGEN